MEEYLIPTFLIEYYLEAKIDNKKVNEYLRKYHIRCFCKGNLSAFCFTEKQLFEFFFLEAKDKFQDLKDLVKNTEKLKY